jgi:hypothetical protein
VSHDLINQQQAALGFLELLEGSKGLSETERALLIRTVEALEHTARLLLQVRTALIQQETGTFEPVKVPLDRALEDAKRTADSILSKGPLKIELRGTGPGHSVLADELLTDMFTQLFLLLGDSAPAERQCKLIADVRPSTDHMAIHVSSEGFALNPMVTDSITGERGTHGWSRSAASVSLVRHLLVQYEGEVVLVSAPPGTVGAHLVIRLPTGTMSDALDNDS